MKLIIIFFCDFSLDGERTYKVSGIAYSRKEQPNGLDVYFENSKKAGDYNVWATDYKTYSLVYSCQPNPLLKMKQEEMWILSRNKNLDADIIAELKGKLVNKEVDISKITVVDQSCN